MRDRRKLERFQLRLPAEIEVVSRAHRLEQERLTLQTENICSGGAYFCTSNPLPKGIQVRIDMLLNFHKQKNTEKRRPLIKVQGTVLRSEAIGMAIRFDNGYKITLPPNA